jgi:hypothetical protein
MQQPWKATQDQAELDNSNTKADAVLPPQIGRCGDEQEEGKASEISQQTG